MLSPTEERAGFKPVSSNVVTFPVTPLEQIRLDIAQCHKSIDTAMKSGATPDDIITTVADAIGLDMTDIPSFMLGPLKNAMMVAIRGKNV